MRLFLKRHFPGGLWQQLRLMKRGALRSIRLMFEACGFVITRKRDYYSPLPSEGALHRTRSRWAKPSALSGVNYDLDAIKGRFLALQKTYYDDFCALRSHAELCTIGYGPGYPHVDAFVLYAMIRELRPSRYIEVGSGLSTYYCSLARERNRQESSDTKMICIEPYPFAKLGEIPQIEVIQKEVQDVPLSTFETLGSGDVLFIDSSHVVRLDGDVPYLFLEVLPRLAPGVHIHIHDIPFPYNIPYTPEFWVFLSEPNSLYWPMYWTEAMLLQALLAGSSSFEILHCCPMIRHFDEGFLRTNLPIYKPLSEEPNSFSSIWLKKV